MGNLRSVVRGGEELLNWTWITGAVAIVLIAVAAILRLKPRVLWRQEWRVYWESLLAVIALPLVPLFLEFLVSKTVSYQTATLAAAMFSISNGVLSRHGAILTLSVIIAMVMCFLFGLGIGGKQLVHVVYPLGLICIVALYLVVERYYLHVVEERPLRN